jgi:hypothetical protein
MEQRPSLQQIDKKLLFELVLELTTKSGLSRWYFSRVHLFQANLAKTLEALIKY